MHVHAAVLASLLATTIEVSAAPDATTTEAVPAPREETTAGGATRARDAAVEDEGADDPKPDAEAETDPYGVLTVGGRVFSRATFQTRDQALVTSEGTVEERTIRSLDLSIPSARIKVEYQSTLEWLSAEVEADFAGRPELKDGYLQIRQKPFWFRAGQFKMPFSAIAMESPWTLPMVDRGFVHDLVSDVLQVGGRHPGLSLRARARGGIRPELSLGAFQGSVLTDPTTNETDLAENAFLPSQHWVARAGLRLGDAEVALSYQHRVGTPRPFEQTYHWTAGADLVLDMELAGGGLRAWAEGMAGESWLEHEDKPADDELATFVMGRAIVAPRFFGTAPRELYLEPFAMLSVLEPDAGGVVSDLVWELAVGMNTGFWDLLRVGIQGEVVRGERNVPDGYLLGTNPDRIAVLGQVGVNF